MTTARDIMHAGVECIDEDATLSDAARKMRGLDVGSLPVCGSDDRLVGIITDRDIVVRCIAAGRDPMTMRARDLAQGDLFWIDADADDEEVLATMESHHVRRLPVIDDHRLVGIISEVDIARCLPDQKVAEFVERVYQAR
jgi:CBS domain-containing protein